MCRLAAYLGTEIPLENIIAKPRHSLLVQSLDAQEAKLRVNGDGFGIAWYGHLPEPGLFKDVLPAWADTNLRSICRLVRSPLFLAHVRAATTGATSRDNCHPFTYGSWSFMHNGGIGDFSLIRRDMELLIPDPYYGARRGTTDSELFFHLLLTNGLETDPLQALRITIPPGAGAGGPASGDGQAGPAHLRLFRRGAHLRFPLFQRRPGPVALPVRQPGSRRTGGCLRTAGGPMRPLETAA